MKRTLVACSMTFTLGCATLPSVQQARGAGPENPRLAYILLGQVDGGKCAFQYKTLQIRAKQNGRVRFLIVNDCAEPTGSISFKETGGSGPTNCVDRATPGSVGPYNVGQFSVRVDPELEVGERCRFDIFAGEAKIDPEIVIIR